MSEPGLWYLSDDDLLTLESGIREAIVPAMEEAFRLHARGETVLPEKGFLDLAEVGSRDKVRISAYYAYLGGSYRVAVVKWLSASFERTVSGLPSLLGLTVLTDADTGLALAVMAAERLTGLRTAAVSALAARYLGPPQPRKLCLVGAGVQGWHHARLLMTELPSLWEVAVYDACGKRARALADRIGGETGKQADACGELESACRGAHLIVSATSAGEPVITPRHLPPAVFYAHVGLADCSLETVAACTTVVADDFPAARRRSATLLARAAREGYLRYPPPSLADLVIGRTRGRTHPAGRTMFVSVGLAFEDAVASTLAYRLARAKGVGTRLPLGLANP